ncbi:MAG: queuosine precursor transporter [Acidobacteriota bacterium]|nr:queuosine precursor transporter [Acidobacteriota bacterium]
MDNARVREQVFLTLAAVFIAALIACNLIFRKFFVWEIPALGLIGLNPQMELSVGILAYPVTFICTDVLSEFYGRRRVSQLVTAGFFASVFVVGLVMLSNWLPAASWSAVDDPTFDLVFGIQSVAVAASMCAYLGAQYLDIRLFHYWKRRTAGRHLWLRNNASTFTSQLVDTILVNAVLAFLGAEEITMERLPVLIANGVVFKWFVAVVDTPLVYGAVWFMRNRLGIEEAPANETRARTGTH